MNFIYSFDYILYDDVIVLFWYIFVVGSFIIYITTLKAQLVVPEFPITRTSVDYFTLVTYIWPELIDTEDIIVLLIWNNLG